MDPVRHPHDALFRLVFGEPGRAAELIRSALPPQLARAIDWGSLRRREESFVDDELRSHQADLLFEVRVAGRDALVYVLVEHKSVTDRFAAFQLLRYVVRVLERWRREHPRARSLPLLLPYVLHHGARPWSGPHRLSELFAFDGLPTEAARSLRALQPELAFVLDDLATQDEATIRARVESGVAAITLLFLRAAQRGDFDDLEATLTRWRQTFAELVQQYRAEGRAEGRVEGAADGERRILLRQLERRFGPLSEQTTARVRAGTPADLERWADRVLTATNLEDVFAH